MLRLTLPLVLRVLTVGGEDVISRRTLRLHLYDAAIASLI